MIEGITLGKEEIYKFLTEYFNKKYQTEVLVNFYYPEYSAPGVDGSINVCECVINKEVVEMLTKKDIENILTQMWNHQAELNTEIVINPATNKDEEQIKSALIRIREYEM